MAIGMKDNTTTPSHRQKLENYINTQINNGCLKAGERLSTVKLAKEWKISEGTVNQSLHILAAKGVLVRKPGLGTFVGQDAEKQSQPVLSNHLAVVMPDLKQPEYAYVLQGLQQAANNSTYSVNACGTDDNVEQYSKAIRKHIEAGVSAIVLIPPHSAALPTDLLIELYNSKIPVVTCFRKIENFRWPMVRMDMRYGTHIAARHLCQIGRKNIGLVSLTAADSYYELLKEHAFIETLSEFGLSVERSMYLTLLWQDMDPTLKPQMWFFRAVEAIENWLGKHPKIDGICCLHDMAAWAVLSALIKLGKRVPEDVAVTGSGNMMEVFGFAHNDLTSVDSCYEGIGSALFKLVTDMCAGEHIEPDKVVEIKGKLIIRHSTVGNGGETKSA